MRTVNDIDDSYFVPSSTLVNGDIYYVTNVEPGMVEVVNGEIQNNLEYVVTAMDDLSYVSYAGGIYKNNDTFYGVSGIDAFESKGSASVLFKPSHYYVVVDSTEPSLSENWENIPQRKFKSYTTKKGIPYRLQNRSKRNSTNCPMSMPEHLSVSKFRRIKPIGSLVQDFAEEGINNEQV